MAVSTYDIIIANARTVAVTAIMCSAPTYTIETVRLLAQPLFKNLAVIGGIQYAPGVPLITSAGGTIVSTVPFVSSGATTASVSVIAITGTYSTAAKAATFIVPFGESFDRDSNETDVGGSPRQYGYEANFIATSGGVTSIAETIVSGQIRVTIENPPRVTLNPPTTNKACSITQV